MRVCVIGGGAAGEEDCERARRVGAILAERGHDVVCGGLGGVMEAACRGAVSTRSDPTACRTIGILPGEEPAAANDFVDVPIATGLGNARNAIVVANGEAAIAVDGRYGTLSEIALALDRGLPVAGLGTHEVEGVTAVESPAAAVDAVERPTGSTRA